MKVLFITLRFYPNGDATGAVIGNLALALKKKGVQSGIIALSPNKKDEAVKSWNGIDVKNIFVPEIKELNQVKKEWKSYPLMHTKTLAKKALYKIKRKTIPVYKKLTIDPVVFQSYKKVFRKKDFFKGFDVCVATLMPHELIIAALKEKIKIPFVLYQLDTFWNNDMFTDEYSDLRKKIEWDAVKSSFFTLTTPLIYNTNTKIKPDLAYKMIATEFPMIAAPDYDTGSTKENDGKIHCVFLGNLYTKIRPPEKVIHFISKIKNSDVIFDFYGGMQQLIVQSPDYPAAEKRLGLWGTVPSDKAEQIRKNADILVNIDNTSLLQVPSKVFEYMCTGKPIINFYFNENSSCLEYLRKYPLCLNINLNTETDIGFDAKFEEFKRHSKGKHIPFEEICSIFKTCTPEYVADKFLECCKRFLPES